MGRFGSFLLSTSDFFLLRRIFKLRVRIFYVGAAWHCRFLSTFALTICLCL